MIKLLIWFVRGMRYEYTTTALTADNLTSLSSAGWEFVASYHDYHAQGVWRRRI